MTDGLQRLHEAAGAFDSVVQELNERDWLASTPCDGWSVADVVTHVTRGNHLFAAALGEGPGSPFDAGAPDADAQDAEPPGAGAPDADAQDAEPPAGEAPDAGTDLVLACSRSTRALVDAFSQPGALERLVEVPFGAVPGAVALELRITELLAHGWDIGRATGHPLRVHDDVVVAAIAFTEPNLARIPEGRSPFSPPRPVPEDAAPIDRLAGLLGREPGWAPPS